MSDLGQPPLWVPPKPAIMRPAGDLWKPDLALIPGISGAAGGAGLRARPLLIDAIKRAGLAGNLKLCLDARDPASYSSGQVWLDRSGGGCDFNFGTGNTADAADPTFVGSAGNLSAYMGFGGDDWFTYDSANEAWMDNFHKNNALGTVLFWIWLGSQGSQGFLGSSGTGPGNGVGIWFGTNTTGFLQTSARTTSGVLAMSFVSGLQPSASAWHLCAFSINEAAGATGGLAYLDGTSEVGDVTYTSPSTATSVDVMKIGNRGLDDNSLFNGGRIACVAAWEGTALTVAEINKIFHLTRRPFGV